MGVVVVAVRLSGVQEHRTASDGSLTFVSAKDPLTEVSVQSVLHRYGSLWHAVA